ncbi:MAG: type VI secretion system protein TssA [Pseudomonadota bacterium]
MIDVDALLTSFGDDAPSGEDLEYDPDFSAMELAAQPGEERQVGDSVIAAEDPDWNEVINAAQVVLGRSKDLRAAVILANAALKTEGIPAFEEVLRYVRGCLEEFWDSVHPQLDADDDDDPTMRVNAVFGLSDDDKVVRALRFAPLTDSRGLGRFNLRHIMVAEGETTAPADMEDVPDAATISAAFQDTDEETLDTIKEAAASCLEHIKAIGAVFDDKTPGMGPDLDNIQRTMLQITRKLASYAGGEAPEDNDLAEGMGGQGTATPMGGGGGPISGAINNKNDVVNMIDRINDYYMRNEPSSPVPLLLNRARKLVSADFVTIIKDMAPQGVENVSLIGGLQEEGDDY